VPAIKSISLSSFSYDANKQYVTVQFRSTSLVLLLSKSGMRFNDRESVETITSGGFGFKLITWLSVHGPVNGMIFNNTGMPRRDPHRKICDGRWLRGVTVWWSNVFVSKSHCRSNVELPKLVFLELNLAYCTMRKHAVFVTYIAITRRVIPRYSRRLNLH